MRQKTYLACAAALMVCTFGCIGDETLRAYGAGGKTWTLTALNGQSFPAMATLSFPARGQISGAAPCTTFTGTMTAPYPWFEISALTTTSGTCTDNAAETAFYRALQTMSVSEVLNETLILRNEAGEEMIFKAVG